MRIEVVPVIEPLATPEGNFRSRLEDVGHFEVRLAHDEIEVVSIFTPAPNTGNERVAILDIADRWCEHHGNVHHIGTVTQHVGLFPG